MKSDILRSLRQQILLISLVGVFIVLAGCSSDDSVDLSGGDWQMPQSKTYEYEVGPEGDVIEVKDHSAMHGFKIVIPEGALAQITKITITSYADAPDLPDGLKSYNPNIEINADAPFSKNIQISFPSMDSPENSDKMLCAFYWDTALGIWQVAMPESFANNLMTIQTQRLSYWQWGEVFIDEVEDETMEPLIDELFGPDYLNRLADAMEVESLKLIDWNNLNYCANQVEIANALKEIKDDAIIRAEENLQSINAVCKVWGSAPTVDDLFYGVDEYIDINFTYLGQTIGAEGLSMVPFIGGILTIAAKGAARSVYEQRLDNLKDEYACIFTNAEPELWLNAGLAFAADAALLGMQMAEIEFPCN